MTSTTRGTRGSTNWLGAPLIGLERAAYERTLLQRFGMATDQALAHVERGAERQLANARALLPFNAILFAVLVFSDARVTMPRLAILGGLLALLGCLFALAMLTTRWGDEHQHADVAGEFRRSCDSFYRRALLLRFTLVCSSLATAIMAVPLLRQLGP
jgi:hypothetical protein